MVDENNEEYLRMKQSEISAMISDQEEDQSSSLFISSRQFSQQ